MEMKTFGCVFNLMFVILLAEGSTLTRGQREKIVMCCFSGTNPVRRQEASRLAPEQLDLDICTHLAYDGARVGEGLRIEPLRAELEIPEDGSDGLFRRTTKLKELKPGLKISLLVLDVKGELKNAVASGNSSNVTRFAHNAADFLEVQGFDGMNLQSIYSEGFGEYIPIIHKEFVRRGLSLLTTVVPGHPYPTISTGGLTEPVSRNLDLILLATYFRFPMGTSNKTEIISSLSDLEEAVEAFTSRGIPAGKLVVPIPAFATAVRLCDRRESGVGAPVCKEGDDPRSPVPRYPSIEIENWKLLRKMANTTEGWVVARDETSGVPFAHSRSLLWTSFEDPDSVREKCKFILSSGLAGASIFNVDMEDFTGQYNEHGVTFSLTRAAFNALNGRS